MDRTREIAVIVVGGAPPPGEVSAVLAPAASRVVIAADSGYDHAVALGLAVDVLVGDLDSISAEGLTHAARGEVEIVRHPTDKDATDTELAIDLALGRGARRIIGVCGGGDRIDHALGTLGAFSAPRLASCDVTIWWGRDLIMPVHAGETRTLDLPERTTFSLLPMHGSAVVAALVGPRFPLRSATLSPGTTLGISNVAGPAPTRLEVGTGVVLCIVPAALPLTPPSPTSQPPTSQQGPQ